jgi:ribonucleoside-diphosphate reductase alpha chain
VWNLILQLVKFKKLSGGGYFKDHKRIIPTALRNLNYSEKEMDAIIKYAVGSASFNRELHSLTIRPSSEKGFIADEIRKLDEAVKAAFEIGFVFNVYALGEECLQRFGFRPEQYFNPGWSMLEALRSLKDRRSMQPTIMFVER